jgi:uncharacterized phage-associated protein
MLSLLPDQKFNERKTTQAAAKVLKLAGGQMNYMLLIKLLYLLDRRALKKWGRPVSGDDYFSMKLGPVLSEVLDLITTEPGASGYWGSHISEPVRYVVSLADDPGDDDLSEAEEQIIEEVHDHYGGYNPFQLADELHQMLPEWEKIEQGRSPITYRAILEALKKTPEEIAAIEEDLRSLSTVRRYFTP